MKGQGKSPLSTAKEWYDAVRGLQIYFDSQSSFANNRLYAFFLLTFFGPPTVIFAVDARVLFPLIAFMGYYPIAYFLVWRSGSVRLRDIPFMSGIAFFLSALTTNVLSPSLQPYLVASIIPLLVVDILYLLAFQILRRLYLTYGYLTSFAVATHEIADEIMFGKLADIAEIERELKPVLLRFRVARCKTVTSVAPIFCMRDWKVLRDLQEDVAQEVLYNWFKEGMGQMSLSDYLKERKKGKDG